MAKKPESSKALFDKTLQKLVEYKQLLPNIADFAKQEFDSFLTLTVKAKKQTFCDFDFNALRLDVFFMRFLKGNSRYKNLTKIIKIIMTLYHGQLEVERGFSINENALVDNMLMETIVAQRKVNDYMGKNNFQPQNMPMSKALLQSAKQTHFRYEKTLDEKQKQKNKKSVRAIEIEK